MRPFDRSPLLRGERSRDYLSATLKRTLPPGFVVPAQPVERDKPPTGPQWVHEIKHDGYRMIVRRAGETVRIYSRRGYD